MNTAVIVHPKLAQACFENAIRPLLTTPEVFEKLGIKLLSFSFPFLDLQLDWHATNKSILLRVDGTDFPYRPVGGWWIDLQGNVLLPGGSGVPNSLGFHVPNPPHRPNCWFCFLGWREYHDHPSHQDRSWASLRTDPRYSVLQLVLQLQRDLNKPGTGVA